VNDEAASEYDKFNRVIETILRADPKVVKEAMKRERKNIRKRKAKKLPASNRLSLK